MTPQHHAKAPQPASAADFDDLPPPAPPPTAPTTRELFPAQVVLRTDRQTRDSFKEACSHIPGGMQAVLEQAMMATIEHAHDRHIRHIDGSLCPISQMVEALTIAARSEMSLHTLPPVR